MVGEPREPHYLSELHQVGQKCHGAMVKIMIDDVHAWFVQHHINESDRFRWYNSVQACKTLSDRFR